MSENLEHRKRRNRESAARRRHTVTGKQIARWYRSKAWRTKRARQLTAHPTCAMCAALGMSRRASVADHVIPHRGDSELFWKGKLQSLCKPCHDSAKQKAEGQGFSSAPDADTGWPMDDAHPFNARTLIRPKPYVGRRHQR